MLKLRFRGLFLEFISELIGLDGFCKALEVSEYADMPRLLMLQTGEYSWMICICSSEEIISFRDEDLSCSGIIFNYKEEVFS